MIEIAVVSAALLLYTYLGYPLLVQILSRWRSRRAYRDASYEPTVSVCVAVYNGARDIRRKLEELAALDYPKEKLEIVVWCDGCTDATASIVSEVSSKDPRIRRFCGSVRKGKPAALNQLSRCARGEVLLLTDVRSQVDPLALRELVSHLADPEVGAVTGVLMLRGRAGAGAYWRYETSIRSCEARFRSLVGVTGTIYAVRRREFPQLDEDLILDDMYVPLRLVLGERKRIALAESAHAFEPAFEDGREFSRKARTLAGNYQLFARVPKLLSPLHNPLWFELVSHKLTRLLCPWALLGLLVAAGFASFGAASDVSQPKLWQVLLGCQGAFYLLATLGPRAGRPGRLARTFVVLHAAAVVGLWRFLVNGQRVTW